MQRFAGRPFALIGVSVGGADGPQVKQVMQAHGLRWRSFVDRGNAVAGPIATAWNVAATPTFYLIDHTGVIRYKWIGPPAEEVMQSAVEKLIAVAENDGPPR